MNGAGRKGKVPLADKYGVGGDTAQKRCRAGS